ncbi:MAG: DUF3780 domain-containing protein [Peptococcaceae bacterium]|nr:DUF3780 domain-containing protein [Peptococcaceae bacterium]
MSGRRKSEGFGFIPGESGHHFLVTIPAARSEKIIISEHFTWDESRERRSLSLALGNEDDKMRVILPRSKWQAIAGEVQAEFNRRLKRNSLPAGRWKTGQTPVSRLLGKELVLLAWAIEDADPALIPVAVKNWLGLAPEERWWLFTMTNAATGHAVYGRDKGWRKAVRYALTENPVSGDHQYESRQELFLIMEEALSWARQREAALTKAQGEGGSDDKFVY